MTVKELVESVDILEYISQYAEFEEKNGEYWCLSPLKEEVTPSFSVNQEQNIFYDFSTGKGGNVLNFIALYEHCSMRDAIEKLKKYAGEEILDHQRPKMSAVSFARRFVVRKKAEKASTAKILPDNYMDRYAFDLEKLAPWVEEGISEASLERFEVRYDKFSDRIMYPIRNVAGQIINVSGRTLDTDFKAKKIRKYTYTQELGTLDTIYGLSDNLQYIKEAGEIILFEGAKSVMKMDTWGYRQCGAVCTSHLNKNQLRILAKLGVRVVFALDKGVDIREDGNIQRLKRYVQVQYVLDTDDMLQDKDAPVDAGREVWEKLYEGRRSLRG